MKTAIRLLPAALVLSANTFPGAVAQEQRMALEEIIVTAEKRSASVQDVPIAVSAFDSQRRDNLGIVSHSDIANHTPSMTFQTNPNRVYIRGVGRVENSLGSEPGVATYRDGIYTAELGGVAESTFFTDRVEVLRGPQGTLYGRNATGGAVNFVSKRPTSEFAGEVRAGVYSFDGYQLGLGLSGPIGERVRYRLATETDQNDGWIENVAGEDVNDKGFTRAEAQVEFDITERLSAWVKYERAESDQNRTGAVMISPYNSETPGPLVLDFFTDFQQLAPNPQLGYEEPNPSASDIHKVNWDDPGYIDRTEDMVTLELKYDFDKMSLKYLYGYVDYQFEFGGDLDRTSREDIQYETYLGQDERTNQHELQLISDLGGKVELILGAFYWDSENYQPLQAIVTDSTLFPTPVIADPAGEVCYCIVDAPANPDSIYYEQTGNLETESRAAYGQVDFYPAESWHFSAGLRYSEDEKTGSEFNRAIFDGQGVYAPFFTLIGMGWFNTETPTPGPQDRIAWDITAGGMSAEHQNEWDSTDWALGLDYTFANDNMIYGKVSTGYKAGGYALGTLLPDASVDEEKVLAYEVGYKSEFERARLNLAAYYYDYEDMQVPVDTFSNGVTTRRFENAEEATVWGVEAELQWAVTDAFTLFSTYSYMDTEITEMGQLIIDSTEEFPVPSDISGNELVQSPENQFSLVADYTWQMSPGDLKFVVSYVYKDNQFSSIFNREDTQVDSFDRTDFRLSYLSNAYDLRVTAYVRNAFDEEIIESQTRSSYYTNNQLSASIQPPRIIGLEVNFGF